MQQVQQTDDRIVTDGPLYTGSSLCGLTISNILAKTWKASSTFRLDAVSKIMIVFSKRSRGFYLFIHLFMYLFIYLLFILFIYLFIYLFIFLFIHLFLKKRGFYLRLASIYRIHSKNSTLSNSFFIIFPFNMLLRFSFGIALSNNNTAF